MASATDNRTTEQAIAAALGNDAKPCYATDYTHARCKYSVNRGWTEDTKFHIPTATLGSDGKSRWHKLFGTPERAALTITLMQMATDLMGCCDADTCPASFEECWKLDACPMDDYYALLEWLRGDA